MPCSRTETLYKTHMHLLDMCPPALLGWDHGNLANLDGAWPSLMTTSHVTVWGRRERGGDGEREGGRERGREREDDIRINSCHITCSFESLEHTNESDSQHQHTTYSKTTSALILVT